MTGSEGSIRLPRGRPFTVRDLDGAPADGNRYELIDGMLLVSPAPGLLRQLVVTKLIGPLDAACPAGLHVVLGPFAVRPNQRTEVRPDVLVARDEDLTETHLPVAPVLSVEVVSPSTVLTDVNLMKAVHQRTGVPVTG
ncbi:MAG TPA: Uma2 family endonuclease [Pseudonocardiaceae bacterium]|nr:Uma2 family endonuclease [Pseudonocardiaceae bacterium]